MTATTADVRQTVSDTVCPARLTEVWEALRAVDDPEYPGVSIVDLGLVESVEVAADGSSATVGLIPTFSGCPALAMIADDVRRAVVSLSDVERCDVQWLDSPVWTTDRMSAVARAELAAGYTVVLRGADGSLRCPICGSRAVSDQSLAGPTRCRSVAWCDDCRNPVEVMRS